MANGKVLGTAAKILAARAVIKAIKRNRAKRVFMR